MRLLVVGLGYVGLANALAFSSYGYEVEGLDLDKSKTESLRKGASPLQERGLSEGVRKYPAKWISSYEEATGRYDAAIIAVGTPKSEDGSCDLSYVKEAVSNLAGSVDFGFLIIRSTVTPGTAASLEEIYASLQGRIISNPEFLRQGTSLEDELNPDRVVVGTSSDEAKVFARTLYAPYIKKGKPYLEVSNASAELGKYASNAFLAMKISFINEMSAICEKKGADVRDIALIMGSDPRIGSSNLKAGIGYGGSCFQKDIPALRKAAEEAGIDARLIKAIEDTNNNQIGRFVGKISQAIEAYGIKSLALLGLSFKKDTPDVRTSLSVIIASRLGKMRPPLKLYCFDPLPQARDEFRGLLKGESVSNDLDSALEGAQGIVILNDAEEWQELPEKLPKRKGIEFVFDGKGLFDQRDFPDKKYFGIGY